MSAGGPGRLRVVLDTNVLVGILAFSDPALEPLREAWRRRDIVPLADAACVAELMRVLDAPQFAPRRDAGELKGYLDACERIGDGEAGWLPACRDRDDDKFLALAARGRADALATRDKALLALAGRTPFAIVPPEGLAASLTRGLDARPGGSVECGPADDATTGPDP